ncbi:hypothetical protein BT246_63100 (plasmid) [Bacillus thuringiensis]|uniref:Uncharacterized protein n=1 Tax=Bacillus thuringiensis TaxID=1428 RepID=A0A9W3X3H3_BACTU|nr:hypothetical protein BT246_63100 [Bacillus thuringiensis]
MNPLNAKVLFVQSGIPFYYPSLEMSIYNALQKVVQPSQWFPVKRL